MFVPAIVRSFPDYGDFSTYDAAQAVLVWLVFGSIVGYFIYRNKEERSFLLQLFGWALLIRVLVSTALFIFNVQEFFGGDAITYDFYGYAQMKAWQGDKYLEVISNHFMQGQASAWGMVKMVAVVYSIIGRNTLAIQFVNSVIGAATAMLVFSCAKQVYQ